MALHYTRKKQEKDEKTVSSTDFMSRMVNLKKSPEEQRKVDKIESTV